MINVIYLYSRNAPFGTSPTVPDVPLEPSVPEVPEEPSVPEVPEQLFHMETAQEIFILKKTGTSSTDGSPDDPFPEVPEGFGAFQLFQHFFCYHSSDD